MRKQRKFRYYIDYKNFHAVLILPKVFRNTASNVKQNVLFSNIKTNSFHWTLQKFRFQSPKYYWSGETKMGNKKLVFTTINNSIGFTSQYNPWTSIRQYLAVGTWKSGDSQEFKLLLFNRRKNSWSSLWLLSHNE